MNVYQITHGANNNLAKVGVKVKSNRPTSTLQKMNSPFTRTKQLMSPPSVVVSERRGRGHKGSRSNMGLKAILPLMPS